MVLCACFLLGIAARKLLLDRDHQSVTGCAGYASLLVTIVESVELMRKEGASVLLVKSTPVQHPALGKLSIVREPSSKFRQEQ